MATSRPLVCRRSLLVAPIAALLSIASILALDADAAPTAAEKCEALKLVAAGRYLLCRINAAAAFTKTGDTEQRDERLAKCTETFAAAVAKADAKHGESCPETPSVTAIDSFLTECANEAKDLNDGGDLPSFCGDGTRDDTCGVDEECDGSDFDGATCQTHGFVDGTLSCTSDCRIDTSACESVRSSGCCQVHSNFLDEYACTDVSLVPFDDCARAAQQLGQFPVYPPTVTLAAPGLVCNGATGLCQAQRTGTGTCCSIDSYLTCVEIGESNGAVCDAIEYYSTAFGYPIMTTPYIGYRCLANSDAYACAP